jgi:hypothetical protein
VPYFRSGQATADFQTCRAEASGQARLRCAVRDPDELASAQPLDQRPALPVPAHHAPAQQQGSGRAGVPAAGDAQASQGDPEARRPPTAASA